jgi:kynureninase
MKSYKEHFRKFLEAEPGRVHFAAHSHHYWPDVTFDAHMRAWLDAATLADEKWDRFFGKLWPRAQRHVARALRLPDASGASVAFAPNTHELVMRVVSCLKPPVRVLTTDGEFHSFARQLARLEEEGLATVVRVPTRPFASFAERFTAAARAPIDLVYVSQVFFDSGYALRGDALAAIASAAPTTAAVIVDGYHAFCAIDVDLSAVADRIFWVAGGYKYAMSGEGCCFMHAPPGWFPRPIDTGWFAAFFALEVARGGPVPFAEDASRFLGATFDPTGLYRFDAVMTWLEREGIDAADVETHTKALQERFVAALRAHPDLPFGEAQLVVPITEPNRGQFLTFETPRGKEIHDRLARDRILTDVRGDRLRFGFALYHDAEDIDAGMERIASALA